MFYGHLFRHAHDAYECFMGEIGWPLDRLIRARGRTAAAGACGRPITGYPCATGRR